MTNQEALDKIVAHFSAPGATLSFDIEAEVCRYRTEDGSACCAVGCLIPSELYDEGYEGNSARMFSDLFETGDTKEFDHPRHMLGAETINKATKIGALLAGVETQFLLDVQNHHDRYALCDIEDVQAFLAELKFDVVPKYNLKWRTA